MNRKEHAAELLDHIKITQELITQLEHLTETYPQYEEDWIAAIKHYKQDLGELRKELKGLYALPH